MTPKDQTTAQISAPRVPMRASDKLRIVLMGAAGPTDTLTINPAMAEALLAEIKFYEDDARRAVGLSVETAIREARDEVDARIAHAAGEAHAMVLRAWVDANDAHVRAVRAERLSGQWAALMVAGVLAMAAQQTLTPLVAGILGVGL